MELPIERIQSYIARHPHATDRQVQKNLNVRSADVKAARGASPAAPKLGIAKPLHALRDEFDDVGKVKRFMATLPKSDYVDDADLRRELKISEPRWRSVRAQPPLAAYQFLLPNKRVVWMHAEAQGRMREAIELSQP